VRRCRLLRNNMYLLIWNRIVDTCWIILTTVFSNFLNQVTLLRTSRHLETDVDHELQLLLLLIQNNIRFISEDIPQRRVLSVLSDPVGSHYTSFKLHTKDSFLHWHFYWFKYMLCPASYPLCLFIYFIAPYFTVYCTFARLTLDMFRLQLLPNCVQWLLYCTLCVISVKQINLTYLLTYLAENTNFFILTYITAFFVVVQ